MILGNEYTLLCSGIAPKLYPTDTIYGLLWYDEENALEIPKRYPYAGVWGEAYSTLLLNRMEYPIPFKLSLLWMSIVENVFYEAELDLPKGEMEPFLQTFARTDEETPSYIIVGMAPYGEVAIWLHCEKKSIIVLCGNGKEVNPSASIRCVSECISNREIYLNDDVDVIRNLQANGLPPRDLFDNYMRQFTYRYLPLFEHWDKDEEKWTKYSEEEKEKTPELDYIEEALYDGTHDKLHDGGLMKYHEAGKPKKLAVQWHIKKSEYSTYFWFEDEEIRAAFDRFYGPHPDTKTDFIIHIDCEKNKYQLALYRYGLKEPVIISESAYQLIVFKNKFECFRSENYDQPRGAWIW